MRLTDHQRKVIRETSTEIFGPSINIKLFGSRVDDALKGGDIDLLVQSDALIQNRQKKSVNWWQDCK